MSPMRRSAAVCGSYAVLSAKLLKSLVRWFDAAVAAVVCGGSYKPLILAVRWFCGGGVGVPPHPHALGARLERGARAAGRRKARRQRRSGIGVA